MREGLEDGVSIFNRWIGNKSDWFLRQSFAALPSRREGERDLLRLLQSSTCLVKSYTACQETPAIGEENPVQVLVVTVVVMKVLKSLHFEICCLDTQMSQQVQRLFSDFSPRNRNQFLQLFILARAFEFEVIIESLSAYNQIFQFWYYPQWKSPLICDFSSVTNLQSNKFDLAFVSLSWDIPDIAGMHNIGYLLLCRNWRCATCADNGSCIRSLTSKRLSFLYEVTRVKWNSGKLNTMPSLPCLKTTFFSLGLSPLIGMHCKRRYISLQVKYLLSFRVSLHLSVHVAQSTT